MRLDHVSYACEPDGLAATVARLAKTIGVTPHDGGVHPRFGTRNVVLPLADGTYLEVVEVLDHPAADKAPFGQAVRARSADGGGWLGWVVALETDTELAEAERRLGRQSVGGMRHRPDGVQLTWRQLGVNGLISDPQLPFLVRWEVPAEQHPSAAAAGDVRLSGLQIAGDPDRVTDWLGVPPVSTARVAFDFVAPHGTPGLLSCTFDTPGGQVRV